MLNFESIIIQPEEALEIKAKYCIRHVFKLEEKNLKSFLTPLPPPSDSDDNLMTSSLNRSAVNDDD